MQQFTLPVRGVSDSNRNGFSLLEVLIVIIVIVLLVTLLSPQILAMRETSRQKQCALNMQQLGTALQTYHKTHQSLPPAAIWSTGSMHSLGLHINKQLDLFSYANWALLLLPYSNESDFANDFDYNLPVAHEQNSKIRTSHLSLMSCPSDSYNHSQNQHLFNSPAGRSVELSRGNYAINGGTHTAKTDHGSTASPAGDFAHILIDQDQRSFQYWGNGVAGFNKSFSYDDFTNGLSNLIALEEIRAGIHPIDPRGTWCWGHIGSSVTWAHGVNGDDYGPNNSWDRADDIMGCKKLHELIGTKKILAENMGCPSYIDQNMQATARSQHHAGVNTLFMDGSVKFLTDKIDPGLWHLLHSRETPREIIPSDFDVTTINDNLNEEIPSPQIQDHKNKKQPKSISNSLGMKFTLIPEGEFIMGLPDEGNDNEIPPETPQHTVQITQPFYLGCFEVTQANYQRVMGTNPAFHQSDSHDAQQFPVEQVTWHDANSFCQQLSEMPEEKAANRTYRLPTEAEWEYACRAGSDQPYVYRPESAAHDLSGDAAGRTKPLPLTKVGSYSANAFGLYDMRGNVWEWCSDWFDRDYYSRSPSKNPQGPKAGYLKVVRGGDWIFVGERCKINYPVTVPWKHNPFIGFRVVCKIHQD